MRAYIENHLFEEEIVEMDFLNSFTVLVLAFSMFDFKIVSISFKISFIVL